MKLTDLVTNQGVYAALKIIDGIDEIKKFIKDNNVHDPVHEHDLHVTLLYSRVPMPGYAPDPELVHDALVGLPDIFTTSEGKKCLVLKITGPTILRRHTELHSLYGGTYDFPKYTPHITLSYDFRGDVGSLTSISTIMKFGQEFSEPLKP